VRVERAHADLHLAPIRPSLDAASLAAARLALLQRAMTSAGFSPYQDEWWHFNDLSDPAALSGQPVFGKDIGL
jgi:D-alanyl-D-alanine dipeptidase